MRITAITVAVVLSATLALAVPPAASAAQVTHVVQPGENLFRIALRYGVTVEAIALANDLTDPERIKAGQILVIPAPSRGVERPAPAKPAAPPNEAASSAAATAKAVPPPGGAGGTHVVQPGDTLYSIARRYGTTVEAVKAANGLRSDSIYPGQALRIGRPTTVPLPAQFPAAPPLPAPAPSPPAPRPPILSRPEVGARILTPQALRVRRGPKSYFTTLALVAPETPLQVISEDGGWYEVQLPDGQTGWVDGDELRLTEPVPRVDPALVRGGDIVREAMRYLGTPYLWGGETSRGVDCSGFVYIVFSSRLPSLARLRSFDYFQRGTPVERADLLPGDLVFFTTYAPGPSHVGIYVGDGKFIQASSGARRVVISPLDDRYYAARYLGARRLLNP